jgi:2-polyprenyl-3-methyl-5-hydroxy-6-metoxy-1,4-benzoquinol methylase
MPQREFLSCCDGCGLIFDNPRPTLEFISTHYSQKTQYDGWLVDLESRNRLWERRIRKMRPHIKQGNLLDVGAGIGHFLHLARSEFNSVTGIEISATAVAIAKRLYNLDLVHGTIESLEPDQQFENLTAFHVLEHVHRPAEFINCCKKLLKSGGRLFLAVPNDIESLMFRIGRHHLNPIAPCNSEIHLSHFTKRSLTRLVVRSGFDVIHRSLDPFWVVSPSSELFQSLRYRGMQALDGIAGVNLYPTIWVVAQKA